VLVLLSKGSAIADSYMVRRSSLHHARHHTKPPASLAYLSGHAFAYKVNCGPTGPIRRIATNDLLPASDRTVHLRREIEHRGMKRRAFIALVSSAAAWPLTGYAQRTGGLAEC